MRRTVNEDIYLVGVDALDAALNEVAAGNMTGTVLNDAQGHFDSGICQCLNRKLCTILCVNVLRVTLDHDIGNFASE